MIRVILSLSLVLCLTTCRHYDIINNDKIAGRSEIPRNESRK